MRKVFFSFEYSDVTRAMVVRNSWVTQGIQAAGFLDKAEFEEVERRGELAIKAWIDKQLEGTSVTVVLVGKNTCSSKWVRYEIEKSRQRGNGLIGVDISKIADLNGKTTERCGVIPTGYPFYLWQKGNGYKNLGDWVEEAARKAGR